MNLPKKVEATRQTFRKKERLVSRNIFQNLVKKGQHITAPPLRLVFLESKLDTTFPAQVAFSVAKRNFKKATDRNRIKRLMREAYRKNKNSFYPFLKSREKQFAFIFIYTGRSIPLMNEVEEKIALTLSRFVEFFEKSSG